MNKNDFINKLSAELGCTKVVANQNLDIVLKCIMEAVKDNRKLKFVGFGAFEAKKIKAKTVKVPNGTLVKVPEKNQVRFSAGTGFKKIINT